MTDSLSNDQLDEVLANYVLSEEAGEPVSRDDLLKQHPHFVDELNAFFAGRDQFKRLASPLSPGAARRNDLTATVRYFGDYELLEEVAQGGMGVVYKARQTSLNRIVAVKMILAGHLATDADVQRFASEAETAASLKHKAIVPIHEVGQQNGQHYFSMDFIDGRNLAEVIRTAPPSPEEAARIVKAIAEAVDYAHSEGIIHRDIKPSNILIDDSGQVHITDFGLALRVEVDRDLTRTGQVLGTPSYMPPEQARGKRDLVGPASDIYSLGAVLYDLLAGRPPFRGESAADTIRQLIDAEPLSPGQLNRDTPRDLETICLKCLAKEPHKRYGTAALLADDLARYLADEPILARRVNSVERAWRWCRREPRMAILFATLATLVAFIATIGPIIAAQQIRLRHEAEYLLGEKAELLDEKACLIDKLQTSIADQERVAAEALQQAELATRRAFNVQLRRTQQVWWSDPRQAEELLGDRLRCPPELRDFTWHLFDSLIDREPKTIAVPLGNHPRLALSSRGELLASVNDTNIQIWRTTTLSEYALIRGDFRDVWSVEFSPSGEWLAFGDNKDVVVWDVANRREFKRLSGHANKVSCVGFSDGGTLLASGGSGEVRIWNSAKGWNSTRLTGHEHRIYDVTFSPTETVLASASHDQTIRLWDTATGLQKTVLNEQPKDAFVTHAIFNASGTKLWQLGGTGFVEWDLPSGKCTTGWIWGFESPREMSRVDDFVALNLDDSIVIWDPEHGVDLLVRRADAGAQFRGLTCSRNGKMMAAASGSRLHIWDLTPPTLSTRLELDGDYEVIALSHRAERLIALNRRSKAIGLWDVKTGKRLKGFQLRMNDDVVEIINKATGRTEEQIIVPTQNAIAATTPGPNIQISRGRDEGSIIIRSDNDNEGIVTLRGHAGQIQDVVVDPAGKTIASAGLDRTVRLWDPITGDERGVLKCRNISEVWQLVFSPSGNALASLCHEGTVEIWLADDTD